MYWEVSSDNDSDDGIKHLLKLDPSKFNTNKMSAKSLVRQSLTIG